MKGQTTEIVLSFKDTTATFKDTIMQLIFSLFSKGTFDIKTAWVNTNSTGAVNVICTFVTNSQALGCLVVLHPWNTTRNEIFAYAARDNRHTPTSNITIYGVPRGNYTMLVFDGEYNGLLSERAAIAPQNITVTAGGLELVGGNFSIITYETLHDKHPCSISHLPLSRSPIDRIHNIWEKKDNKL